MRYADRQDLNYEELESSIVDSLSEISIASSIPLNIQTQDIINRTINEVVSAYLWPSDFVLNNKLYSNEYDYKDKRVKRKDEPTKNAWDSHDSQGSFLKQRDDNKSSPFSSNSSSTKCAVPSLDLSQLGSNEAKKLAEEKKDKNMIKINANKGSPSASQEVPTYTIQKHEIKAVEKLRTSVSASKIGEVSLKSIKQDIELLLKDLKLSKNINSDNNDFYDQDVESRLNKQEYEKLSDMGLNLKQLLERLLEKRKNNKRNNYVERMSREEIMAEKVDTQKELLNFEEKHGRPVTKLEKDLMRPLYDHYRKVKRILTKITGNNTSNTSGRGYVDSHNEDNDEEENNYKDHKAFFNLHSLNLNELNKEKDQALLEKAKLKELIKKYEVEFTKATGRQLTKEDREIGRASCRERV